MKTKNAVGIQGMTCRDTGVLFRRGDCVVAKDLDGSDPPICKTLGWIEGFCWSADGLTPIAKIRFGVGKTLIRAALRDIEHFKEITP